MLTFIPEGGLCNRMRATASAVIAAERAGVPVTIKWYRTPDFNCRFDRIFDSTGLPFTLVEADSLSIRERIQVRLTERIQAMTGRLYSQHSLFDEPGSVRRLIDSLARGDLLLRSHDRFIQQTGMFACFSPSGYARDEISRRSPDLADAVGVHIRRADNSRSISRSPAVMFEHLMDEELQRNKSTLFFVASDSDTDVAMLRGRYPGKILTYPKRSLDRNDPRAIEDAVVDLFLLSACRSLIGSYWSSFTDTAHALRSIPYVIAEAAD